MSAIDHAYEEKGTQPEKPDIDVIPIDNSLSAGNEYGSSTETGVVTPVGLMTLSAIKSAWDVKSLVILWAGAIGVSFVVAYDQTTSSSFAPYATSSFSDLSLLGLIGTIQGVISAVMQQPLARLADVYGRFELFTTCVVIVTVGEIMLTASTNINVYAAAQIFFVVGLLGLTLMLQLLAADSSDLKNRLIMSAIPLFPVVVTSWTSAPIVTAILDNTTWRWGYGIFAIMFPILSVPLLGTLWWNQRKSTRQRKADGTYKRFDHWLILKQLDLVGFILFSAGLTLLLLPLSLASSSTNSWRTAHIIVMIVIGVVTLAVFVLWEWKFAKWPLVSLDLFTHRTVVFGSLATLVDYLGQYSFASYFFAYMLVYSNLSVAAATNVLVIQPFMSNFGLLIAGLISKFFGRPKWIISAGFCVNILGMGLTFAYRDASHRIAPLLVGQGIFGLGQGLVYTIQTSMQASVSEDSMAQVTALSNTASAVGGAFGSTISAGIWLNILPRKLLENLPASLLPQIADIEGSVELCLGFAWGTPERTAISTSYDQTFRIFLILGLCCEVVSLGLSLCMNDLNLKVLDETRDYHGVVIGKSGAVEAIKEHVIGGRNGTPATKEVVE